MIYTKELIHEIKEKQKQYFASGVTLPISFRIDMLKKLKNAILSHQDQLVEAMNIDLGRTEFEAYICDIGPTISEINETIRGLKKWAKAETHFSGFVAFPSFFTKVYKIPYGNVLIVSPFNFPVLLSLGVLNAAICGGNTAIIKASSKSAATTKAIQNLIKDTFPEEYITVIDGGHDIADFCLEERFDKIFYTGSPNVAKHVMELASKNLTPVALELGGENGNWAIIRKDANIKDAARKIAFFKTLNSGQICINVNQVAVAEEIADEFIKELINAFKHQIGEDAINNPEYPKLIGSKAFDYTQSLIDKYRDKVVFGGSYNRDTLKVSPTIIYPIEEEDSIVNEELFSPILPVVPFIDKEIDALLDKISKREHGLALYVFTKDKKWAKKTMQSSQYGSGGVNEVCLQIMVKGVPFNGVGHSGMGAYHGEWGFKEFTHPSSVIYGKTHFNLSLREHPYSKNKEKIMKKFLK